MRLIGKTPRGALFTVAALAVGGLLAACGSAGSSSTSASGTTATTASAASGAAAGAPNSAQRTKLEACLKQHGVTLPARPAGAPGGGVPGGTPPTGGGSSTTGTTPRRGFFGSGGFRNNPKLRSAFQACGARFGFRGGAGGGFRFRLSRTNITKYVTCVRQHGYNLPNPNFSGQGPIFPANIRNNAKFQAASKACQSLLVPPRPSGSGTGTSTTAGA